MLSGEAFLERVFTAYRSATSPAGPNVWNTPLLIGWDEPDGTYDHVRDPDTWASVTVLPVPEWTMGPEVVGRGLSTMCKGIGPALIARAQEMGVQLPAELSDRGADLPPQFIVSVLRQIAGRFFPLLATATKDLG